MSEIAPVMLEYVSDGPRAAALVQHPLRRWILAGARHPVSATELAAALGLTRQRVNYHVRQLVRAGYLRPAGRRIKRNLVERKYVATARSYVLLPQLLGPLAAGPVDAMDPTSAAYLMGLTSMAQQELAAVSERAGGAPGAQSDSLMTELQFEDEAQRAAFGRALRAAVADVLAEYSSPRTERPQAGERPFRLVIGYYPIPEPGRDG
jgi:hypothetical protein